jgi:adenosylmethionine-8-amino-7-oxononanoate transaminase
LPSIRYQRLRAADRDHVWHPFTQMQEYNQTEPLVIERGEGVMLFDVDGNAYYDAVASIWTNTLGHADPVLTEAIVAQARLVAHSTLLGQANVPSIELAERLAQIAPGNLSHVFFCDSGAEAVEIALKMAYQYWRLRGRPEKRKFVKFADAYHGDTIGAVSVGAIDMFHAAFSDLLFETYRVPFPNCYRCPLGLSPASCAHDCLDSLRQLLAAHGLEIAALIVEPVQGSAGIIPLPADYLGEISELCRAHDVLLIDDEVATGFGRTGAMFACEHDGVVPDLMTVGKGLTGGYLPVAATLVPPEIYEEFLGTYAQRKTFFHGHTFTGNQLGCAVALANLAEFERRELLQHVNRVARVVERELSVFRGLAHVGDVRQVGLFVGIELVRDRETKEPYAYEEQIGMRVGARCRELGLLMRPLGSVVLFIPPLVVTEQEACAMLDILRRAIADVTEADARR